jgi:arsenite methyltransferase
MINAPVSDAASLPQADASALVDRDLLETQVRELYRLVATEPRSPRHFETGRGLALRLGYPDHRLAAIPPEAVDSFAGVGYHFDLVHLAAGESVLDLGSGSGTDAFYAARIVGPGGRVAGVDLTDIQVQKARSLAGRDGFAMVTFTEGSMDELPFADASFDVVISNGSINLSPVKHLVFAEAARVLRPGGRLAIADMVSAAPLAEGARRSTELWASCIGGAIPRDAYADAVEDAGFRITSIRRNHYRFVSERARQTCRKYGIASTTIAAVRRVRTRSGSHYDSIPRR